MTQNIDKAGQIVADEAMRLVARHPRMTKEAIDRVILAMKSAAPAIVEQLLSDIQEAPTVGQHAVQAAILELASAGFKAI